MPIPKTRAELVKLVTTSFEKLRTELDDAGPQAGSLSCVDEWSVKDLLAVRAWWTESVVDWVEAGRRGEVPTTPAPGYRWKETPRLNAELVKVARRESLRKIRSRLQRGYERVLATIDSLDDTELLTVGVFEWAGRYPISRWISINTARQYTTARQFIRRALREAGRP
ncbi:MAG: ClbS/DfsB family four-helix bundle protein [Acidobacteriota bacterium]|nr:ClbS/DfsB family four-helix bundle protein [Acidobacteriota bacterium]